MQQTPMGNFLAQDTSFSGSSPAQLNVRHGMVSAMDPGTDALNQAAMAVYNNDYNYWLWQQQASYNSPAAQRRRMEEAGLNPNYQSIDGGNLGSIPSSTGSITPSVGRNATALAAQGINAFNALIDGVKKGVETVSELSGIPHDIVGYRKLLSSSAWSDALTKEMVAAIKQIEKTFAMRTKLGLDDGHQFGILDNDGNLSMFLPNWENSPLLQNLNLKNDDLDWLVKLREYDFRSMKPAELQVLEERARQIGAAAGLTENQNRLFTAMSATKIGAMLGPVLLGFIKLFL